MKVIQPAKRGKITLSQSKLLKLGLKNPRLGEFQRVECVVPSISAFFQLASQLIFKIYYDQHFTFPRLHSWPIPKYVNWIFDIIQARATPFHLRLHNPWSRSWTVDLKFRLNYIPGYIKSRGKFISQISKSSSDVRVTHFHILSAPFGNLLSSSMSVVSQADRSRSVCLLGQSPHVDVSSNLWLNRVSPNMACPHTCMYMWHQF